MQAIHIFGFGRKEEPQSFITDITVEEDLEEIKERTTATNQRRVSKSDDSFIGDKARRHRCTNS